MGQLRHPAERRRAAAPAVVEKRKAELSDDYRRNVLKLAEVPAE